jgi:hypothetical protein
MKFTTTKDDLEFRNQMESCKLPASEFDHRAHLRLAYIYLTENNADKASELMKDTLHQFIFYHGGDPSKYHETITKAWILAVRHFMNKAGASSSADELIERSPKMLDTKIMMTHYSAKALFSDKARTAFVEPDLDAIPRYGK